MANHLSQENTRHSMKSQKDMTPEDEAPRLEGIQYTTREEWGAITNIDWRREDLSLAPGYSNSCSSVVRRILVLR